MAGGGVCRGRACPDSRVMWLGEGDGQPEARRAGRVGKRTGNTLERTTPILNLGRQALNCASRWRVCFCL